MQKTFFLFSLFIVLFLFGCATQHPPTRYEGPAMVVTRPITSSTPMQWTIEGVVSIQTPKEMHMGSFTWEQINNRYAINLYGPLNFAGIGIAGIPGKVTLHKPTGTYSAPTPEALMRQQLGWYLPVSNLYFWIRGLPAPGYKEKLVRNKQGQLAFLKQQGWSINYLSFETIGDTQYPQKIILDNGQLHVKLVIKHWNIS